MIIYLNNILYVEKECAGYQLIFHPHNPNDDLDFSIEESALDQLNELVSEALGIKVSFNKDEEEEWPAFSVTAPMDEQDITALVLVGNGEDLLEDIEEELWDLTFTEEQE